LCRAEAALINYNIVRLARADHPLRIYKAVYVNRDPAVIHEHEVLLSIRNPSWSLFVRS
jgi:hypothetical protein